MKKTLLLVCLVSSVAQTGRAAVSCQDLLASSGGRINLLSRDANDISALKSQIAAGRLNLSNVLEKELLSSFEKRPDAGVTSEDVRLFVRACTRGTKAEKAENFAKVDALSEDAFNQLFSRLGSVADPVALESLGGEEYYKRALELAAHRNALVGFWLAGGSALIHEAPKTYREALFELNRVDKPEVVAPLAIEAMHSDSWQNRELGIQLLSKQILLQRAADAKYGSKFAQEKDAEEIYKVAASKLATDEDRKVRAVADFYLKQLNRTDLSEKLTQLGDKTEVNEYSNLGYVATKFGELRPLPQTRQNYHAVIPAGWLKRISAASMVKEFAKNEGELLVVKTKTPLFSKSLEVDVTGHEALVKQFVAELEKRLDLALQARAKP